MLLTVGHGRPGRGRTLTADQRRDPPDTGHSPNGGLRIDAHGQPVWDSGVT
ncbi:MAG: hypothetical protein ACK40Z_11600 [Dietzia sp.]